MSAQKGALWWAAHHRRHHASSDSKEDIHSPMQRGFWWSHVGWFLCSKYNDADPRLIRDLIRFRELLFLNRFHALPPAALAVSVLLLGTLLRIFAPGLHTGPAQMLVWGFFVSTVLVYHGTFLVNSLAHVFGRRRFPTKDDSRNNFLIALLTFGEGWHNNHHYAPSSERQGFYWWEIDLSHCILQVLNCCGVVWDLQKPPPRVMTSARSQAPAYHISDRPVGSDLSIGSSRVFCSVNAKTRTNARVRVTAPGVGMTSTNR
jgi:stearoyl-CoA desaturase (delta-9 desaturase)